MASGGTNLRQEINKVEQQLSQLKLKLSGNAAQVSTKTLRNRRRRQRQRQKKSGLVPGPSNVVAPQVQNVRVGRNMRGQITGNVNTGIRIRHVELLQEVKDSTATAGILLKAGSFTWLSVVSSAFDRIKWHGCTVFWKPAVGTNQDGMMAFGADWNGTTTSLSRAKVLVLNPVFDGPVWQANSEIVLPASQLMTRKEYDLTSATAFDSSPCSICYAHTVAASNPAKTLGEIWVSYDVTLSGTRK